VVLTTLGLLLAWGVQRLIFGPTSWFGSLLFVTAALVLWLRARKMADQSVAPSAIPAASRPPEVVTLSAKRGLVISAVLFAVLGLLTLGNHPFTAINLSAWFAALGLLILSFSGETSLRAGRLSSTQPAQIAPVTRLLDKLVKPQHRKLWMLNPSHLRVRVKWVGLGSMGSAIHTAPVTAGTVEKVSMSPPIQVLRTFDLPKLRVRVSWVGFGSIDRVDIWAWGMFALSLGIFAFTRLIALDQFPIYFFSDEAIQVVYASELVQNGFHDPQGHLFPAYFQNAQLWNLSLSVYIHALAVKLFGVSIIVTRATSALIAISGAIAVSLMLKWIFQIRWWWLGALVLAATPAWFLHSRTAFETVMMVSFYSWFLLFYLLYRYRSPNFLYAALLFGAATFYSYNVGQSVILISGVGLLISDWRYHLKHWRTGVLGVALLAICVLPYVRFRIQHPEALTFQLRALDSYWLQPIFLQEKVSMFIEKFTYGLSPQYWFVYNEHDLIRHRFKDYGHIAIWQLLFYFFGLGVCVSKLRSSAHRAILIALLSAPFGSALVDILVTRALLFVVPAAILAVLGFDALLNFLKIPRLQWVLAMGGTAAVSLWSISMLNTAVTNGPLWYSDYALYGMQWGARQIFEVVPTYLEKAPASKIYIGSDWANGTSTFVSYFTPNEPRVQVKDVDDFILNKQPLNENDLFVLPPQKYDQVLASGKFQSPVVEHIIKYPDGRDGFYFARLAYVNNADEIFAAEIAERAKPVIEELSLDGETIKMIHSRLDMGQIKDLFDDDTFTLVRGLEANPLLLDFEFLNPRPITGLVMDFGGMDFALQVKVYGAQDNQPISYQSEYRKQPPEPHVDLDFDNGPALVRRIYIEIQQLNPPDEPHIHVREVLFKE
jgi:hypothetical protein